MSVLIHKKLSDKVLGAVFSVHCQHRIKTSGFHRSEIAGFLQKYTRSQRLLFSTGLLYGMNHLPNLEHESDEAVCPRWL